MLNPELLPHIFVFWIIITIIWYTIYIKDILLNKTKPHIFTWLIGWISWLISFVIQFYEWAWLAAYITLLTSISCLIIASLSLTKWEKNITKTDKMALFVAIIAIILWILLENSLYSAIALVSIVIFWFYPTVRKSYYKPFEETMLNYTIASIKFSIWFLTLSAFTPTTITLQLTFVFINVFFVLFLLIRRNMIKQKKPV